MESIKAVFYHIKTMEKIPYFIFFRAVNENACMSLITSSMWYFFYPAPLLHMKTCSKNWEEASFSSLSFWHDYR